MVSLRRGARVIAPVGTGKHSGVAVLTNASSAMLPALLSALSSLSIDPRHAKNITVYHVTEHKFGAIPVNMDTGDALGDMFFDMLEVILYPLTCPDGPDTPWDKPYPSPCTNPETAGADLRVNKLTLEVDERYSQYAMCNVGVNDSDPFGGSCPTDTYCCDCFSGASPNPGFHQNKTRCNATLGYENIFVKFGKFGMKSGGCKRSLRNPHPTKAECYASNTFAKLNATSHGSWFSSLDSGYCGGSLQGQGQGAACTWRVLTVEVVKRECHTRVFGAEVAKTAPGCLDGCGAQRANSSSLCWIDCFYQAALGPHAGRPGETGGGMSTDALVAAWQKPFLPEAEGGCPAQKAATPWFEVKPPMVEAVAVAPL